MTGAIRILRIEVDGHFHGSPEVPKPWVAKITGVDPKFGLARTFVDRLNDYRGARRACSGNLYGVVAAFPLRAGHVYEVSRLRGNSSRRHVAREFVRVAGAKFEQLEPIEALAIAEGYAGPTVEHRTPDGTAIALVRGLGTPEPLGFILRDERRIYRLREGHVHEVRAGEDRRLVLVRDGEVETVGEREAIAWLTR